MNIDQKIAILADAAKYDASCASSGTNTRRSLGQKQGLGSASSAGICHSFTPDGRCVSLLKILLTNFCTYDCLYCVNRKSSDIPRARFTPDEIISLTIDFYRRNYIEGLFLSSGIIQSSDYTMEQLVKVAKELRQTHHFRGYIHLKTIPGASEALIAEAGLYADRLSINIEMPTEEGLKKVAPEKKVPLLESAMKSIHVKIEEKNSEKSAPRFCPAGQSTQMIIGADATPDRLVLKSADRLYRNFSLKRVYYSAYSPTPHPSQILPPSRPPLLREHRLYQADWLLRFYGFHVNELLDPLQPNLSLEIDPKLDWALRHREHFPVDLNKAPKETLLRVPGLGVRNTLRLLAQRRWRWILWKDLEQLRLPLRKMAPFIMTADYTPKANLVESKHLKKELTPSTEQLELFENHLLVNQV